MKFFGRFHPATLMTYFAAVLVLSMFSSNPVIAALAMSGGCALMLTMSSKKQILSDLSFFIPMLLMITLTNPLFSHNGKTPLFFMNGNAITLEAIAYGLSLGVTLLAVVMWCRCYNRIMTGDKFMYLFGKSIPQLSLVLSMALRYVPMLRRQAKKVEQAQTVMGLYGSDSRFDRIRSKLAVMGALVGWSLENAVEVSRSMRARGYGLPGHSHYSNFIFTRADGVMLAFTLICAGAYLGLSTAGFGYYTYYPGISPLDGSLGAVVSYVAFGLLALAPAAIEVEENLRWNCCKSKI